MLSNQDNELLCRPGPGTLMGDLFRQYWLPALMSRELPERDGPPLRVRLLGEDLVAWRATDGSVGLLQHACPHRGASMFFGRNEENGLRCVYHGWKFDADGACVDMPNEPAESNFRHKVRAGAYPTRERSGIVWAYLGPRTTPPPLPDLEVTMVPEAECTITTTLRECNWLQGLEGDVDTSHLGFLHLGSVQPEDTDPASFDYYLVADRAPRFAVIDTDFGTMYGAYRPSTPGQRYWRLANFLFPCWTMIPTSRLGAQVLARAWVPVDDHHMMMWHMVQTSRGWLGAERGQDGRPRQGHQPPVGFTGQIAYQPPQPGWLGRWRAMANRSNDYHLDRTLQRTASYTGIDGIALQDQAITESLGPIVHRATEHLGSGDAVIVRLRSRLLQAGLALARGVTPPGVDDPAVYRQRSGGIMLPENADWVAATAPYRQAFVEHGDPPVD